MYTDVKRYDGNFKDAHNYLVSTTDIAGQWSEPVYLNSSGFDPSLFHENGRQCLVNLLWNHRAGAPGHEDSRSCFGGIVLQEFDEAAGCLIGESRFSYAPAKA